MEWYHVERQVHNDSSCADPENVVRGGQTSDNVFFFLFLFCFLFVCLLVLMGGGHRIQITLKAGHSSAH